MNLIRADKIVIAAMLLYIITLSATNFVIHYKTNIAKQLEINEKAVRLEEANWIYGWFLQFQSWKYIWGLLILPSFLASLYWYCRQKWKKLNPELLEAIAVFFFVSYLYNVINDVSILLGVILQ